MRNERKFDFTQVEGFERVLKVLRGEAEATEKDIEFIKYKQAQAKNKNKSKASTEKPENAEILAIALEILKDGQKRTLAEIVKEPKMAEYTYTVGKENKNVSISKLTTIFNKEIYNGINEKGNKTVNADSKIARIEEGKGKLYFTIKE